MVVRRWQSALLLVVLECSAACSSSAQDGESGSLPPFNPGSAGAGSSLPGGGQPVGGAAALPPEMELDQTFRAPVATGTVLWSANPDSGRVALIDAKTLAVRMTNAGFGPTYLAAVPSAPGSESAIVINVGSHDATWLVADPQQIAAQTIATHVGANAWAISKEGRFAIAWTDVRRLEGTQPDTVNGYSELTVIDLVASPPTSTRLSVGFRPSQILFDEGSRRAFAVVDEGISVLDLSGPPSLSRLIAIAKQDQAAPSARDVNIAADGSFAVVRVEGSRTIEIIDLASDQRTSLTLESNVTDLDLSADGASATAVLGNAVPPRVVSFAVPVPRELPAQFESATVTGELVRSVTLSPDGQLALLYANAVPSNHLTLLDTSAGAHRFEQRTVDLQGAVQSVFISPDSAAAITFQAPPLGSKKKGIFSIVPTRAVRAPRIVGTDALPSDVAFSDVALGKALVTVHDSSSAVRGVYVIGLANLEQNFVPLASDPLPGATGIVPLASRGFVAQRHPEGRITFIDLETGNAQTVSGFEIAARVTH